MVKSFSSFTFKNLNLSVRIFPNSARFTAAAQPCDVCGAGGKKEDRVTQKYQELMTTDSVRAQQERYYGRRRRAAAGTGKKDVLSSPEIEFIAGRDSFYMSTVSENGWPYIQHRGGPRGFLRATGPSQLVFADYAGNRQLLSAGNLAANDRVALILVDYPEQLRLKILGHARMEDARGHRSLGAEAGDPEIRGDVERLCFIDVVSFDWNCSRHITPRFTREELRSAELTD